MSSDLGPGGRKKTFTIDVTAPGKFAAQWHDRMPLVPELEAWDPWLNSDPETGAALMKPPNEDVLTKR